MKFSYIVVMLILTVVIIIIVNDIDSITDNINNEVIEKIDDNSDEDVAIIQNPLELSYEQALEFMRTSGFTESVQLAKQSPAIKGDKFIYEIYDFDNELFVAKLLCGVDECEIIEEIKVYK